MPTSISLCTKGALTKNPLKEKSRDFFNVVLFRDSFNARVSSVVTYWKIKSHNYW